MGRRFDIDNRRKLLSAACAVTALCHILMNILIFWVGLSAGDEMRFQPARHGDGMGAACLLRDDADAFANEINVYPFEQSAIS